jgi:ribosomal protein S18 acetylase RimI-like enzyme
MRVEIRGACAGDVAGVIEVLLDTYRRTWRPQLTPGAIERIEREDRVGTYVRTSLPAFQVAVAGRRVVGMIHWRGNFVVALHVHGDVQRRGVGRALLAVAEAAIRSAGHAAARLETDSFNTRSLAFYARHGYREIGRYPDTEWDSGLTTLLLEKALG